MVLALPEVPFVGQHAAGCIQVGRTHGRQRSPCRSWIERVQTDAGELRVAGEISGVAAGVPAKSRILFGGARWPVVAGEISWGGGRGPREISHLVRRCSLAGRAR